MAYGHLFVATAPLPTYTAVAPSVTAYIQSVSPTIAVKLEPKTAAPETHASSGAGPGCAGHVGLDPVKTVCTTRNAALIQLSPATPRSAMPAAR